MPTPLVDKDYLLQKFPFKGGWTYAEIPEIPMSKENAFGMLKVCGTIDGYEFSNYRLMPLGNGSLMIAVKAEIRKKIGKQAGDVVRIVLYADDAPPEIPDELALCLREEEGAFEKFTGLSDGEQKAFIDWIYDAKTDDTKVLRIVKTIEMTLKGQKLKSNNPMGW